jgi:tripartite-type tricarboxylate transporter receptor subunit TctC
MSQRRASTYSLFMKTTSDPAFFSAIFRFIPSGACSLVLAGLCLSMTAPSFAQAFPNKPIRFVVPYPAGGPVDQIARILAEKLRDPLGQPVIVENKAGAGGNIGADSVAKATPDGYTLVMGAVATHAINPSLYAKMPYDANRDFTAITRVAIVPNVLVLNTELAQRLNIRSVKDLTNYARANPGKLNYGSGGNGSAGHLAGELYKAMGKLSMVHIPYGGAAPAQIGLISGQTDLMFDNLASAAAQIKNGKLLALAVTSSQRSPFFPELPTIAESGLTNFDISTWFGVFAPSKVPADVVTRLFNEYSKVLKETDFKDRLIKFGAEPAALNPQQFTEFVLSEQKKYALIVKASGAKVD